MDAAAWRAGSSGRQRIATSQALIASAALRILRSAVIGHQPQVGAALQAFMDLQAGGALVAVDENKRLGHGAIFLDRKG